MVAHDRYLLSEVADEIWQLDSGAFTVHDRGYEQYAEARKAAALAGVSLLNAGLRPEPGGEAEKPAAKASLSREEARRIKREQAELRNALYKRIKPLQDKYAALEHKLETLLAKLDETQKVLADPEVYADSARTTELLKEFHALQSSSETVMEDMAALEARIAPLEEKRQALADVDE